jgi:hypothetical protein
VTPFHQALLVFFVPGLLLGLLLSVLAGATRSIWWSIPIFLVAAILVWGSLVVGVAKGYDAWQAMPDPPDEAFADGAKLTGSVLFGWLPSGLFCAAIYLITRLFTSASRSRLET